MKISLIQRALLAGLLLAGVAGCAVDTHRPPPRFADLGFADRYTTDTEAPAMAATEPPGAARHRPAKWWEAFDDPVLDALVEHGNSNKLDVQAAALASDRRGATAGHGAAATGGSAVLEAVAARVQAGVASRYIALRGRQVAIADARAFLVQRQALIQLAQFRAQAGLVPALDAARAVAGRDEMAARIADLEAEAMQHVGQIAMLTGQAPEALADLLAGSGHIPTGPADVALGRRSDLLLRRADLRTSAARLAKSGAGDRRGAMIDYKRSVLEAVQEVETQNTAFQHAKSREIEHGRAVATAEAAALLARQAYADGQADYTTLDQVETRLFSSRTAWRAAQVERAVALIGLYVALGGDANQETGSGGLPSPSPKPPGTEGD